jgi:hypothetical protein
MASSERLTARAEEEWSRSGGNDEAALARSQVLLLFAVVEQLRELSEQIADLRRLQHQTRDRTF